MADGHESHLVPRTQKAKLLSCSSLLLETELPSADLWNAKNS